MPTAGAPLGLPPAVDARVKAGDLIFRIGNEWQSDAVRGAGAFFAAPRTEKRGDPYSHVGMLVGAPGHWQVLHSVPAEAPGRKSAVVVDDLDFFVAPERARGIAIYRVEADEQARAAAVRHAQARLGVPFRIVADDAEGQYCTTLIWFAWQKAGVDLGARFEHLNAPLAAGNYLLPHSLRMAERLRLLHAAGDDGAAPP
ncbi:MAG: hypothetical protein LBP52_09295 [Burkholderiaceae bacterium]|nr:hypothetical protein [Burkholderiaceae bacterium]